MYLITQETSEIRVSSKIDRTALTETLKSQETLKRHLMLCSRSHLHRYIFGLKHMTLQDFNIMHPVWWGGLYLSSDYWLLFAQTLYFSKIQKLHINFYLYTHMSCIDIPLKTQATGYRTFRFTNIFKGYHGWGLSFPRIMVNKLWKIASTLKKK